MPQPSELLWEQPLPSTPVIPPFPLEVSRGMRSGAGTSPCPSAFSRRRDRFGGCQRMLAPGAELCHQPGCSSPPCLNPTPSLKRAQGRGSPSLPAPREGWHVVNNFIICFPYFFLFSCLFSPPPHPAAPLQQPRFSHLCWVPVGWHLRRSRGGFALRLSRLFVIFPFSPLFFFWRCR